MYVLILEVSVERVQLRWFQEGKYWPLSQATLPRILVMCCVTCNILRVGAWKVVSKIQSLPLSRAISPTFYPCVASCLLRVASKDHYGFLEKER